MVRFGILRGGVVGLVCGLMTLLMMGVPTTAQNATMPPTNTRRPTQIQTQAQPTITIPPTNTPRATRTPNITETTATPTEIITVIDPASGVPAQVCFGCNRTRLRTSPGTSGTVIIFLDSALPLTLIGRDADGAWVQVIAYGETVGWVATELVITMNGDPLTPAIVDELPVTGQAVNASPTPTSAVGIPSFISNVTSTARRIYQNGQALGNRANVFSKVGDSITASAFFLYPIGYGQFNPGAHEQVSGAVSAFRDSFTRNSVAAAPGWTAVQLLTPGSPCGSQITPLACEYQLNKPAVALIMIGTNDSGSGSAGVFAEQLRQVVQVTIDAGVVPVLSTIPPKRIDDFQNTQVDAFNRVIRQTAVQFDVPLWDYYAQMVRLPNAGMDADGLHPSVPPDGSTGVFSAANLQYGYTVRNMGALYVLDVMRRLVLS
jgi:hypothetical protein